MAYPKRCESREGVYTVYMHHMKPTGKRYIGMTGQDPYRRFQNGYGYEKNEAFFDDIVEYGWDSVETTFIAQVDDFELAASIENAAIERYNTTDSVFGYNLWTSGSRVKPNPSVGRKISKARMGHEVSEETREKIRSHFGVEVVALDDDYNFVASYPSMTEAAMAVGGKKANISAVCQGKKHHCKGYRWMTLDDYNNRFSD